MPKLGLDRQQLAKFLPSQEAIRAFERVFESVDSTPTTIEEAANVANFAVSIANQAIAMLASYAELLEQLSSAPAVQQALEPDDFRPTTAPAVLGTLSEQDANAVAITGGSINGTTVGATTAASGAFTTLTASAAVALSPANDNVVLSPTGTGLVTVAPATLGSMNRMTIGDVTPAAATVTNFSATGTATLVGGTINGMTVGATVPLAGTFTTVTGTLLALFANGIRLNGTNSSTTATGNFLRFSTNIVLQTEVTNLLLIAKIFNGAIFVDSMTISSTDTTVPGTLTATGGLVTGLSTSLVRSNVAMANGAAAAAGTLLNAPAAGNPTKWIPINDNGTTRYIPAW